MNLKTLLDIVSRIPVPSPWQEGENLPWHEPGFSQRMLNEHLSQEHDAASRRLPRIEEQVGWIHSEVLGGRSTRILDICCGPGLYTNRLAALGHECVGIDFSPAAIAYAKEQAKALPCRYVQEDVRRAEFGSGFGLVMMVFGQLNVFRRTEARALLGKARQALADGGLLLLEPQTLAVVERMGTAGTSWYAAAEGLFAPQPHLVLEENFWDAAMKAATTRFFVVDAKNGEVTRHAMTTQGYSDDEYLALLRESGFADIRRFPSLTGEEDPPQNDLFAFTARAGNCP
jgi:SAM-dependent methyltransferase